MVDFLLEHAARRREGVDDRERLRLRHDAAMREAAAEAEQHDVGRPRLLHSACAVEQETQIALVVAMQHPVAHVGARVERLDQAEVAIDAHQQHRAVDAGAFDVGGMMVGRADPTARGRDDGRALGALLHQTAICGGGTNGKPRKLAMLENTPLQVACVWSHPA